MAGRTIVFQSADGLRAMLRGLPKEANVQLREEAFQLTEDIAAQAADSGDRLGGIAAIAASSLSGRRDREPTIKYGNSKKLPVYGRTPWGGYTERSRKGPQQTIGAIIFGAEFGSKRFRQFRPWTGNDTQAGYFLYPTIRDMSDEMQSRYWEAVMRAIDTAAAVAKRKK